MASKRIYEYQARLSAIGINGKVASHTYPDGRKKVAVLLPCDVCGNMFWKPVSSIFRDVARKHCCTVECRRQLQRESVTGPKSKVWKGGTIRCACSVCGKEYDRKQDQLRSRNSRFCSKKCFGIWKTENWSGEGHPRWAGGHVTKDGSKPYFGGWDRIRKAVRTRDGNKCRKCGSDAGRLHVHHIVPFRFFDSPQTAHQMSNHVTLCVKCHAEEESKNRNMEKKGKTPCQQLKKLKKNIRARAKKDNRSDQLILKV